MVLSKSALAGTILTASALVLSACTTHHVSHPRYREVGPAHHHRTVVHPPARHRTVIVRPPARHRTVIVHPSHRGGHRAEHGYRHRDEARVHKPPHHRKYGAGHRKGHQVRHRRAAPPVHHRSTRVGSTRDPHKMVRTLPPKGHIGGGRPGRPDVVMPKTRPRTAPPSRSSRKQEHRSTKRHRDNRRARDSDE